MSSFVLCWTLFCFLLSPCFSPSYCLRVLWCIDILLLSLFHHSDCFFMPSLRSCGKFFKALRSANGRCDREVFYRLLSEDTGRQTTSHQLSFHLLTSLLIQLFVDHHVVFWHWTSVVSQESLWRQLAVVHSLPLDLNLIHGNWMHWSTHCDRIPSWLALNRSRLIQFAFKPVRCVLSVVINLRLRPV